MTKRHQVKQLGTRAAPKTANLEQLWQQHEAEPVAADAIYTTLREAIISGALPAGERLAEVQLAGRFKRSRTPVREAILRLESEHFARRSPRRGFVVSAISREQILEVYAVREVLEGLAARLAAQTCLPKDLDQLAWLNQRLCQAGEKHDYRQMMELNIEFHESIARISHNGLLLQFHSQIHDWMRRFTDTTFSYPGRIKEAAKEHEALLAALGRRDPETAERIARTHMVKAAKVRFAMQHSVATTP